MSVFKIYRGKRITPRDKNWSKGTWYMWRRVEGKIIHKALKTAQTKEEAEIAEREEIRRVFDKKYRPGSTEGFTTFVDRVYRKYVLQNNVSLSTKNGYIKSLCETFKDRPLMEITPQDCRNVQAEFKKRYSASTVNQLMSTASKIFRLAGEERIIDINPMAFVTRLKEPPARDRLLSKEEWERLWIELESDPLLFRLITLAVNLPLRRGQLLAISPDAINFQDGFVSIIPSKGRASRIVPMNGVARHTLNSMIADGQLPFPLKETGLRKRWVKALKRAKIEGFRFHDLRHCTATELHRNGVPMETIRKLYGHSAIKITQVYVNPDMEEMAAAVRTLDGVQDQMERVQ